MMVKFSFSQAFDYVVSSMCFRWGITVAVVSAIGISITMLYLTSQFGFSMKRHAEEQVSPVNVRKVILRIGGETAESEFSEEYLSKLPAMPEIDSAAAYYEVSVDIKMEFGKTIRTTLESAGKQDLVFGNDSLKQGTGLKNDEQIVLGQPLADSLQIKKTGGKIFICLERIPKETGKTEQKEWEFTVCGIVKGEERAYVLPETAKGIDCWRNCSEEKSIAENVYHKTVAYIEDKYFAAATEKCKEFNLTVQIVTSFNLPNEDKTQLFHYAKLVSENGRTILPEIIATLNMSKPLFRYVRGSSEIDCDVSGKPIHFFGATPNEPIQSYYARWFSEDNNEPQVVLEDVYTSAANSDYVPLQLTRLTRNGKQETLQIPLKIIGRVNSSASYVPLSLCLQLNQWKEGNLNYRNGQFCRVDTVVKNSGTPRAKLYLRSVEDFDKVAQMFRPKGMLVEHNTQADTVRQLGKALTYFVPMMCGSSFIVCFVLLLSTIGLTQAIKNWDLNCLMLMGVRRSSLQYLAVIEGVIYAVVSLAMAIPLILILSEPYKRVLLNVFPSLQDSVKIGLLSSGSLLALGCTALAAIFLAVVLEGISVLFCIPKKTKVV